MNERLTAQFEQIGVDTLVRAETIQCEPEDFVDGLQLIVELVNLRFNEACEEFGRPIAPQFKSR